MSHTTHPVQHVHGSRGHMERAMRNVVQPSESLRVPTIASSVPLTDIMTRSITCARRELTAERVAELMVSNHIGCVPVVDEAGHPVGMITKLDLVERIVALDGNTPEGLANQTAGTLMMPLSLTLNDRATIAHAAALIAIEDIHHVSVVDGAGRLIGIVSTMDVVRWLARNDGFMP